VLELRKIAITGGLGTGKTLVCKIMEDLGACVVSTDELVHQLLINDKECIQKIEALLGQEVKVDHQIDRKKVASLVFSNKEKLDRLEKILHPLVFKKMEMLYREACELANEALCCERSLQRGLTPNDYSLRSKRLLSSEQKLKKSNFIIDNSGTVETLKKQVTEIIKKIEE
jgi:dephospho-CoA kinase